MTTRASGTFDVKLSPLQGHHASEPMLGRMAIDKVLHGDLEATGRGEMLTAGTDVKGSAGYVAVERITGRLHGRTGSFAMQHSGAMSRGAWQTTITVVPDSGTGELAGIAGAFHLSIREGKHFYDLDYTLPEPA